MSAKPVNVCQSCPFRRSNEGKRVPKGVYTTTNLRRLWRGVSEGKRLACLEQATPGSLEECGASLLLVARHLDLLRHSGERYTELALTPLSAAGVSAWMSRRVSGSAVRWSGNLSVTLDPSLAVEEAIGVPWACPVTNDAVKLRSDPNRS